MNKQFLRVRQKAIQKLGRAEKTEVLNEDLQQCEKKLEQLKTVIQTTTKKLHSCLQGSGNDHEKRLRKLSKTALAQSLWDSSNLVGPASPLGSLFSVCSDCEGQLAKDLTDYEILLLQNVLTPLNAVIETDIPNVTSLKRKLMNLTLDMDSAHSRWQSAAKSIAKAGNAANPADLSKEDQLKREWEEATNSMSTCRETYLTELLTLLGREGEFAQTYVTLMEAQAEYHRNALENLEKHLPEMKSKLEEGALQPIFGCPLDKHLQSTDREIALVLEACVVFLLEEGMNEEGIFRIGGSTSKIRRLKATFNYSIVEFDELSGMAHEVTGVLKQYFRELPEPIMTFQLYDEWLRAASMKDKSEKIREVKNILQKLPKANYDNLQYLLQFLHKLSEKSETTKMPSSNLALVITPNIIYPQNMNMESLSMGTGKETPLIDFMIQHTDTIFPEEIVFSQTYSYKPNMSGSEEMMMTSPQHTSSPLSSPQPSFNLTPEPVDGMPRSPKPRRSVRKPAAPNPPSGKPPRQPPPPVPARKTAEKDSKPPPATPTDRAGHLPVETGGESVPETTAAAAAAPPLPPPPVPKNPPPVPPPAVPPSTVARSSSQQEEPSHSPRQMQRSPGVASATLGHQRSNSAGALLAPDSPVTVDGAAASPSRSRTMPRQSESLSSNGSSSGGGVTTPPRPPPPHLKARADSHASSEEDTHF